MQRGVCVSSWKARASSNKSGRGKLKGMESMKFVKQGQKYIPKYHALGDGYVYDETVTYYSYRYNRRKTIEKGECLDGATGAMDIKSLSWGIHDMLCKDGTWDNGDPVTNWQASCVLSDILSDEGRWFRARTWLWATFLMGCKKAREVGMFRRRR